MAIDAIQSYIPFLQSVNPFQVQTPQPQEQQPKIGKQKGIDEFELPENINLNPQLSFLRGEALTNKALGEADAIYVKGGKAGIHLNTIC